MKSVIYEYAGAIVALIGAITVLQLFTVFLLGDASFTAVLIKMVLQKGA